jgi:hypothetical protein
VPARFPPRITVDYALSYAVGALAVQRATVSPNPPERPLRERRRFRRSKAERRVPVAH